MYCEEQALQSYLSRGYKLSRRRWKNPFAEIDLLLRAPDGAWVLVEVKSLLSDDFLHVRVKRVQKRKLFKALQYCLEKVPNCRLELAVVSQHGDVQIVADFFG